MLKTKLVVALSFVAVSVAAASAQAPRALSGEEIATMIAGNTVEGTMAAGGPYKEFYLPDGTLRGSNYDGSWDVAGDTLCFTYDPSSPPDCWAASITSSNEILWLKNGNVGGNGLVIEGNPGEL